MARTAIVIGGGIGGMFCGALLAREGLRVIVLEKNDIIGGGLQSFTRRGQTFDTGMHVACGLHSEGSVWRVCQHLGIADKLNIRHLNSNATDRIHFVNEGKSYEIACGVGGFVDSLSRYFPSERMGLQAYAKACLDITAEMDLFNLRDSVGLQSFAHPDATIPADKLIEKYIADNRLRSLLAYICPRYGARRGKTPAYVHATLMTLYLQGGSRFVGGTVRLAEALSDVIGKSGGEVLTSHEVCHIDTQNKHVESVSTTDGRTFTADYYVGAADTAHIVSMVSHGGLTKAFCQRVQNMEQTYSAFTIFISLRDGFLRYEDTQEQFVSSADKVWCFGNEDEQEWPTGLMMSMLPDDNQGLWARRVVLTAPMSYDMVSRFAANGRGKRQQGYAEWKKTCAERAIEMVERVHKGFASAIENLQTASPLTISDYYGNAVGSLYGRAVDTTDLMSTMLNVHTKIDNLFLTGQNINLHGLCGCVLTAIETAEAIVGANTIRRKIRQL